jgi:hypothetical protein
MAGPATELLEIVTAATGDSLRTIAIYDTETYVFAYQRDDIRDLYVPSELDDIHEALVAEGMGSEYLEDLFNAGQLHCSNHVFEEGTMFHFLAGPNRGLFVSIDADAEVPVVDLSARCKTWLQEQDFEALLEDT